MQIGGKKKKGAPKKPAKPSAGAGPSWGQPGCSSALGAKAPASSRLDFGISPMKYVPMSTQHRVIRSGGLVILKWAMDLIPNIGWWTRQKGERQGGFYEVQPTGRARLNQGHRGHVVAQTATADFPLQWTELCMRYLRVVQGMCPALQCDYNPTTCLVNFYDEQAEFKWHKDSENPEQIRR